MSRKAIVVLCLLACFAAVARAGALDERVLAGNHVAESGARSLCLVNAPRRDLHERRLALEAARLRVLDAVEQLAQDAE